METSRVIVALVKAFADLAVEAFATGDPAAMKKVADVLPPGSKLQSDVVAAIEREKTRRQLIEMGERSRGRTRAMEEND